MQAVSEITSSGRELPAVIAAELDPSEHVLWYGRPDVRAERTHVRRRLLIGDVALHLMFVFGYAVLITMRLDNNLLQVDFVRFVAATAAFHAAVTVGLVAHALFTLRRCGSSFFAITRTRVITVVQLSLGRVAVSSIEPLPPLTILRRSTHGGTEEVLLNPTQATDPHRVRYAMGLTYLHDGRDVEALLRRTFGQRGRDEHA
jgi:hypothetical protein